MDQERKCQEEQERPNHRSTRERVERRILLYWLYRTDGVEVRKREGSMSISGRLCVERRHGKIIYAGKKSIDTKEERIRKALYVYSGQKKSRDSKALCQRMLFSPHVQNPSTWTPCVPTGFYPILLYLPRGSRFILTQVDRKKSQGAVLQGLKIFVYA